MGTQAGNVPCLVSPPLPSVSSTDLRPGPMTGRAQYSMSTGTFHSHPVLTGHSAKPGHCRGHVRLHRPQRQPGGLPNQA